MSEQKVNLLAVLQKRINGLNDPMYQAAIKAAYPPAWTHERKRAIDEAVDAYKTAADLIETATTFERQDRNGDTPGMIALYRQHLRNVLSRIAD